MNIFEQMGALLTEPNFNSIKNSTDNFWKLAKEIRVDLGTKGYYLDQYLSTIFETMVCQDLTTEGDLTNNICWSIHSDCHIICGSKEKREKSEFFDIVKDYIDNNPINFNHNYSKVEYYAGNILIEHLDKLSLNFKKYYRKKILRYIDFPVSDTMYKKISYIIGEKRMDQLNETICEAFVFAPIMMAVSQQIIIRGLQMLLYRDPETSKQIYQLMLEGK